MFFDATLSLDPAQVTTRQPVAPDAPLARLLQLVTGGRTGPQQEVETFTGVAILHQLDMALRGLGITNLVRLARDGHDVYLDTTGRDDDLALALEAFERDGLAAHHREGQFESLKLVVEHNDGHLRYLVEVDVARAHAVGGDPIVVGVSAVMPEFAGDTRDEILAKLVPIVSDQATHDAFVADKRAHFSAFIVALAAAIQTGIPADRVQTQTQVRMVRPTLRIDDVPRLAGRRLLHGEDDDDWARLFHGYRGIDRAFLYAWLWPELARTHGLHLHDLTLVDETGRVLLTLGSDGVDAASWPELASAGSYGEASRG
jgi:hypothetical protein